MFTAGYIATIFMGLILGVMGGGGSILTVPILVYLFQIPPVTATGYSLFVVGITSLVGALIYFRRGETDFKTGLALAVPSAMGVSISRLFLLPSLPLVIYEYNGFTLSKDILIMVAFAGIMLAAAISMIRKKPASADSTNSKPKLAFVIVQGLVLGLIAGFVGAGGGFLIIPALVMLAKLPMRKAIGTSLMIITFQSLIGFIGDVVKAPFIDWNLLLLTGALASSGIAAGSLIAKRFNEQLLKKAFGIFVLLMGAAILLQQFAQLTRSSL